MKVEDVREYLLKLTHYFDEEGKKLFKKHGNLNSAVFEFFHNSQRICEFLDFLALLEEAGYIDEFEKEVEEK